MAKTIKISEKTHNHLSNLASKNDTFNDVINHLIDYYNKMKNLVMKNLNFIILK